MQQGEGRRESCSDWRGEGCSDWRREGCSKERGGGKAAVIGGGRLQRGKERREGCCDGKGGRRVWRKRCVLRKAKARRGRGTAVAEDCIVKNTALT